MTSPPLDNHFFRHEYGKLVAVLSCQFGVGAMADIEDAVQAALMSGLERWTRTKTHDRDPCENTSPERDRSEADRMQETHDRSAWLYRVARNRLIEGLRKESRRRRLVATHVAPIAVAESTDSPLDPSSFGDSLLKMLFVACDEAIPLESQLVLSLKVLCGFDVREIALRLFTSEANVYKRLARARARLCELTSPEDLVDDFCPEKCATRLPRVLRVLYLIFTEGHLSSQADSAIRSELCEEAIRLGKMLVEHPVGRTPETYALLALMLLHAARTPSRTNGSGGLLLLEEQDRQSWDQNLIEAGLVWLGKSAAGEHFSRYHAEAGIAAEHCLADSFDATRWDRVAECYELLEQIVESPIHRLNRAVAVGYWQGAEAGLALLEDFEPPVWLSQSYLWSAVVSDLSRQSGDMQNAIQHRERALAGAPSNAVRDLLTRRLTPDGTTDPGCRSSV
ncbi:MAG: DUF6596 domain-containing protein [Planctomycetota bacterium]